MKPTGFFPNARRSSLMRVIMEAKMGVPVDGRERRLVRIEQGVEG